MSVFRKCSLAIVVLATVLSPTLAGAQEAPNPNLVAAVAAVRVEQRAAVAGRDERPAALGSEWRAAGTGWWFRLAVMIAVNQQRAAERARSEAATHQPSRARAPAAAPSTGHDPCANPDYNLLPAYIVQRESRGQCGAFNATGCKGHGCLGWAQIDQAHWNEGGQCYGLDYNGCVIALKDAGGLSPWKCC